MQPKPWYLSKSIGLGLLTMVLSVINLLVSDPFVADYPQIVSGLTLAAGFLTIVTRFFTKEPITRKAVVDLENVRTTTGRW